MLPFIRSALFIPANNPGMITSAALLQADAIIYDLEDAVSINEKDSARTLLKEAFAFLPKTNLFKIVRVNPYDSPFFYDDVAMVSKLDIDYILLAKADIKSVEVLSSLISDTEIKIITLIESATSVFQVGAILSASQHVEGLLFGAEDYALDMQIKRTKESEEILVARQNIAIAAHALDKFCIDTPFTDVEDFAYLQVDAAKAKNYGFSGKACINPRQVTYVNEVFTPSIQETIDALEVIEAAKEAEAKGLGVFSLNGKMVDAPIINRAKLIIETANKAGVKYE